MEKKIAEILLELKAVSLSPENPFTWASGLRSPIYCDNRLVISDVAARRVVMEGFMSLVNSLPSKPDIIAGTATAGIPHAAWLADALQLPMIYVRSSEKKHGRRNLIEGTCPEHSEVFLVEDLISTGGSSVAAALAIRNTGARVLHVASIFSYGLKRASSTFCTNQLEFTSLTNLATLQELAHQQNRISDQELQSLRDWARDPQAWSDAH